MSHHTASSRRNQDIPMASTSRDPNAGQVPQQQVTEATNAPKLSGTELNILQTMIAVIACFIVCWSPIMISNVTRTFTVCQILPVCAQLSLM